MTTGTYDAARVGRRTFLARTGLTVASTARLALLGCQASGKSNPTAGQAGQAGAVQGQPVRGGVLQWGIDNLQDILDPHQTTRVTYHSVWHNVSHHLVGLDPNLGGFADNEASQSMEQRDQTTMIFKLWPGITWQSTADVPSRPFTSRDVAYNLKGISTNDPRFARRDNFQKVDSVTTPDDSTVVIKLKQAYAPQLFYLGSGLNVMVNDDHVC